MSAAAAQIADAVVATPAKGKKKLLVIVAALLLVTAAGGGAAVFFLKKQAAAAAAAAEADDEDGAPVATAGAKHGKGEAAALPTFLPLEPFVVNLADKDADRYAQIGITLEVDDPKVADQLKAYMPAIRNGVLMVLAHKTSAELLQRSGKVALANEIMREAVRPLGIELDDAQAEEPTKAGDDEDKARRKPKKKPAQHNPLRHVHFSNFIIQ